MKILVTGASGFLGQAIVEEFLSNDVEVVGVSKTSGHFQADITVEESLDKLSNLENIDAVIHSAGLAHQFGKTPRENFFEVNVKGTENVLKLAKTLQIKHFILISSVAVYGVNSKFQIPNSKFRISNNKFQEESECNPIGDYAQSKYEAEKLATKFCAENNIRLTILRPATIIGEGDKGNVSRLITTIKNKQFYWIGKGENIKSLIDKNDAAEACFLAAETPKSEFQIYNLTADPIKMRTIVEIIADELKVKIPKLYMPEQLANLVAKFSSTIKKWLSDDVFSGDKISSELGFQPQTDIKESIGREVRNLEN
jgi:nucleoside-diphosphate-sugar epimerase